MIYLHIILLIVSGLLWAFLIANLLTLGKNDPAGRGLAEVWAVGTAVLLWMPLLAITWVADHDWVVWQRWCLTAVQLYALFGLIFAIALYAERGESAAWILVPMLLPGLGLVIPAFRWLLFPFFVLCVVPVVYAGDRQRKIAERRAKIDAEWKRQEARQTAEKLQAKREKFAALTESTPLWVWQEYAQPDDAMREEALTKIRTLPNRQAEAEAMLEKGFSFIMRELPRLDLQPTPALLAAGKKFVADHAKSTKPPVDDPGRFDSFAHNVEYPMDGVRWLVSHGCDLRDELAALAAAVRQWGDTPRRQAILTELAQLQNALAGRRV